MCFINPSNSFRGWHWRKGELVHFFFQHIFGDILHVRFMFSSVVIGFQYIFSSWTALSHNFLLALTTVNRKQHVLIHASNSSFRFIRFLGLKDKLTRRWMRSFLGKKTKECSINLFLESQVGNMITSLIFSGCEHEKWNFESYHQKHFFKYL